MLSEGDLSTTEWERSRLLKALRESELLRELSELLASSLDPTHILQVLVRRTTEVCDVERCAVWLLDEAQGCFMPSAYHFTAQHIKHKAVHIVDRVWRHSTLPFDHPIIHRLLQENGMLFVEDLCTEPSMHAIAEKFFVRSVLLIALVREGRPVGMMSLDNPGQGQTFTEEQQQLARTIGQQAAVAIDNAHLYQQAQVDRKRAERLIARAQSTYQVAMAVNSGEDLPAVLEIATQHLVSELDAQGAAVVLLEKGSLSIASQTAASLPLPCSCKTSPPDLSKLPYCTTASKQGLPLFVQKNQLEGIELNWFEQMGMENVMIIPLMIGSINKNKQEASKNAVRGSSANHCVGFTFINFQRPAPMPASGQFAFAQDIAAQCALAIEKAHILNKAHHALTLATERANTLSAVFNAMTEGVIVLDMGGHIIMSNETAMKFIGLPRNARKHLATYLQQNTLYTLYGQPIPLEEFPLMRALQGEHIRGERFIARSSDDSEHAIEVNIAPLFDSEDNKIGIVSAFRDITEQVRVERRIRRALDTMLHAAEAISGVVDIKEILHHLLAMTMTALNCERGAVQLYEQEQDSFKPLLSIGFLEEEEEQWIAEQKCWLAPEGDEYNGFRNLLLEGRATLVNAEQCPDLTNIFHHTMILAAPITHNNRLLGVIMLDRSSAYRKGSRRQFEFNITRPLMAQEFSVWDMAVIEGIAQFAGLAIEQTRWQQEAEIARTNETIMREANAVKDEFLAITAHEFRTPLTVILAHSQMMARLLRRAAEVEPTLKGRLDESISFIEIQAHQLTNIVNTFLEVTRLNRGQIVLNLEEIDLQEIVKQVVANHTSTAIYHHISCTFEPADTSYLLIGDRARLFQVFANLLQNAIKYSPLGGPIIISLQQNINHEGKKQIEVRVRDRGIGVLPEAQPHLFERFYRAPNIGASQTRGIGLGLYVVAQFLHLHGGTIRVESSGIEGEGSCFIFTLPVLERDAILDESS